MRRAALRTRLARLEQKSKVRRLPRVVAHIYDYDPDKIIGFRGGGTLAETECDRASNECVSELAARAFDHVGSVVIAAIYAD